VPPSPIPPNANKFLVDAALNVLPEDVEDAVLRETDAPGAPVVKSPGRYGPKIPDPRAGRSLSEPVRMRPVPEMFDPTPIQITEIVVSLITLVAFPVIAAAMLHYDITNAFLAAVIWKGASHFGSKYCDGRFRAVYVQPFVEARKAEEGWLSDRWCWVALTLVQRRFRRLGYTLPTRWKLGIGIPALVLLALFGPPLWYHQIGTPMTQLVALTVLVATPIAAFMPLGWKALSFRFPWTWPNTVEYVLAQTLNAQTIAREQFSPGKRGGQNTAKGQLIAEDLFEEALDAAGMQTVKVGNVEDWDLPLLRVRTLWKLYLADKVSGWVCWPIIGAVAVYLIFFLGPKIVMRYA